MDIKEKYYFYLVDLIEDIMSKMIEDNDLCNNIKIYKILNSHFSLSKLQSPLFRNFRTFQRKYWICERFLRLL